MGSYYFDTSALVKHYRREAGTQVVERALAEAASTVVISRLCVVELVSAFALHVRMGEISQDDFAVARKRFFGDISSGLLLVANLKVAHFRQAERLIERHATARRLRTLDALQLSVAIDLFQSNRIDTLFTADAALRDVALLESVPTINPITGV